MEEKDYINQIEDLDAEQIAEGIFNGVVKFEVLQNTGKFDNSIQRKVKSILKKKDDDAFMAAHTISDLNHYLDYLNHYLDIFPEGSNKSAALLKVQQLQEVENANERRRKERERMLQKIKDDINYYTPNEIKNILSDEDLDILCNEIGLDVHSVKYYEEPDLKPNDIPKEENDVPEGYTDIFFWGIPSSGKTCALASILSTITKCYTMEAADTKKQFGATYRDNLINIFHNDVGNLPDRTVVDTTQYMPFLFSKRGEENKRKISFFELSGEVFKYFYEVVNNRQIIKDESKEIIKDSFNTLELLLNSNNQKIHYFFIDYNQETKYTKDNYGLTQSNYLQAAATYFRNRNIFKKKTDAVYLVITKSDEIKGYDRIEIAKGFLQENFGAFMDVLKMQCKRNSVLFKVKLFSIGNVYFKRICKIDRSFSDDIIQDLLKTVKPSSNNIFRKFFNR